MEHYTGYSQVRIFPHTHSGTRCVALGRTGTGTTERALAIGRPLTTMKSLLKSEMGPEILQSHQKSREILKSLQKSSQNLKSSLKSEIFAEI